MRMTASVRSEILESPLNNETELCVCIDTKAIAKQSKATKFGRSDEGLRSLALQGRWRKRRKISKGLLNPSTDAELCTFSLRRPGKGERPEESTLKRFKAGIVSCQFRGGFQ